MFFVHGETTSVLNHIAGLIPLAAYQKIKNSMYGVCSSFSYMFMYCTLDSDAFLATTDYPTAACNVASGARASSKEANKKR